MVELLEQLLGLLVPDAHVAGSGPADDASTTLNERYLKIDLRTRSLLELVCS